MNTEFEKHAREQFKHHEMEVDANVLWADVYPHVKKEKGNRKIIWFFLLGLILSIVAFGLFDFKKSNSSIATTTLNTMNDTDVAEAENHPAEMSIIKNINTTTNYSSDANINFETNSTEITTTPFSKNNTISAKSNTLNTKTSFATSSDNPKTISQHNLLNSGAVFTKVSDSTPKSIILKVTTQVNPAIASSSIPVQNKNSLLNEAYQSTIALTLESLNSKAFKLEQPEEYQIPISQEEKANADNEKIKAKEAKRKKRSPIASMINDMRFGLGLYVGISKSTANLEAKDAMHAGYVTQRNLSEERLETLHFGFGASIYSKQNIYLRTGIEYTRIASVFSRESELVIIDSIIGITEVVINKITLDTIGTITGLIPVTTTTRYKKKTYNYTHLLDIPVILGYQYEYKPWTIGVEGGIYANISSKTSGEISLPDNSFYDLETDTNKWYKTNIGIQPYVGINAAYNLSDNLQIHISPGFRFDALFSTDNNLVKEQHSNLGLQAGIRYIFD